MTEQEFIKKYDNKENFSEEELKNIVWNYPAIFEERGEKLRWKTPVSSVFEIEGRFFLIPWYEALTEYQMNEFMDQPIEVIMKKTIKTIEVIEWQEINEI